MIDIPQTTAILELFGAIVKDVGICAGTAIALASLVAFLKKAARDKMDLRRFTIGIPEWLFPGKKVIYDNNHGHIVSSVKCSDVDHDNIKTGGYIVTVDFGNGVTLGIYSIKLTAVE